MKSLLLSFLFAAHFSAVCGQTDRFNLCIEYSPNFSNITQEYFYFYAGIVGGLRFSHNLFLQGGYQLRPNLYATAGIGLMETRELLDWGNTDYEIDKIQSDFYHYYIVAPVGITYYIGSFFITPQVGIGWNINNRLKHHIYYWDGTVAIEREDLDQEGMNKTTYPIFLSIGHEINMKTYSILIGLKGYYSLNPQAENYYEKWHYYGFGVVTGVRF